MLPVLLPLLLMSCQLSQAMDNGVALTPPMGWLSWERFRCNLDCKNDPDNCVSERLYMTMADLLVSEGYKDVGYEYVNIDDCWPAKIRDSNGRLVPDPDRFPSGMKALADYVHAKGLKLGIYEDFGTQTCAGYPGSEFYMETDAKTFAEWEVDSVKFDGCNSDIKDMPAGFTAMSQFLNRTGRPMLFDCEWPGYWVGSGLVPDYLAVKTVCNMWRNYVDIQDSWDSVVKIVEYYGGNQYNFSSYAGPGGWNDPDELIVGDFGLSYYQQKAQFGLWALFAAPLMMSLDLRSVDPQVKALLQNTNIIAINQDPLGSQAVRVYNDQGYISVWLKQLSKPGSYAVGIFNEDNQGVPAIYRATLSQFGLKNANGYQLIEAFENKIIGNFSSTQQFKVSVDPTSIYIFLALAF